MGSEKSPEWEITGKGLKIVPPDDIDFSHATVFRLSKSVNK